MSMSVPFSAVTVIMSVVVVIVIVVVVVVVIVVHGGGENLDGRDSEIFCHAGM
jgi:hypothetical protein